MQTVPIHRRRVKLDIDGKIFKAKELSVSYLQQSLDDEEEAIDLAIQDSVGDITEEDLKGFGVETKNQIYFELIKFTFQTQITEEDQKNICEAFNIKVQEFESMNSDTQLQLKNVLDSRQPRNKDSEKK